MDATTSAVTASAPSAIEKPKIVLYWLEQSRSQRILWLLEELQLPYELKIFHRDKATKLAPPELRKIHPLGKSPVIEITPPGATAPIVIAESSWIVEYLAEHYAGSSGLVPMHWKAGMEGKVGGETEEWMKYKYFLHYAEGSLMTFMILALVSSTIRQSAPFIVKPITNAITGRLNSIFIHPNVKDNFDFLEKSLKAYATDGKQPYLCGNRLTAADILLSYPLIAAKGGRAGPMPANVYPLLTEYIDRMENEPGYKKAVDVIVKMDGKFEASI